MKTIHCPRCSKQLNFVGEAGLKPGGQDLKAEVYACPKCGKMEFFAPVEPEVKIEKVTCAACQKSYDIDFPRCPGCGSPNPKMAK